MILVPKNILPVVAWSTIADNVIKLSDWTYRATVHPINMADPGAKTATKAIGDYLVANTGRLYSITSVDGENITVKDDFETGLPPWQGFSAIVFRSVGNGKSQWLPPIRYEVIDRSARSYLESINLEVLWRNDPNSKKIEFTDTSTPSIVNYQTFYAADFGEMPKIQIFTYNSDGVYWERQEKPIWNFLGGLLDSIVFDLSDIYSGYIIISK